MAEKSPDTDHGQVSATPAALDLIRQLQAEYGPIMFHQSGGCCDGSSPMCYPQGEFIVGDTDVKLGEIGGAPVYISGPQYETYRTQHPCRSRTRRHVFPRQWPRGSLSDAIAGLLNSLISLFVLRRSG